MNIDEAIKILNNIPKYEGFPQLESTYKAVELGIEALKEIRYLQRMDADFKDFVLPSETQ